MTRNLWRLLLVPPWIAAAYGTLQIHNMDLNLGTHSICGPWGCGPRPEALIGYHGFWALLLIPGALALGMVLPRLTSRFLGLSLLVGSALGTVAYLAWDVVQYTASADSMQYAVQRGFFTLVTTVDLPMLQAIVAGALLFSVLGRCQSTTSEALPSSQDGVNAGEPSERTSHDLVGVKE